MKKRTIIIGMFILFLVGVISIIGTYAIDSTITEGNSSTADYLFNITLGDRTNREVVIPSYDSKIVDIKISNPNEFNMSYLLYIEGVNSNISVINIKDTEASGVLASKTVTIIQVFIQNNSSSDVTIKIKDIVGFEKEILTLPDNSTSINKGNYYKAIVRSNNNTYGKVKPNIKLSTLNGTVKYEIVPNTGYKYKSTTCTGSITDNILTISNITSNINCEVVFEPIKVQVNLDLAGGVVETTYTEPKEYTYTVPATGTYKIELWGAQGLSEYGGKGGYTKGEIKLNQNDNFYVYVGGTNGYNGGGSSSNKSGGGATDVRLTTGTFDNFDSLKSRIMVAAGGGAVTNNDSGALAGNAGGLVGYDGVAHSYVGSTYIGTGASQSSGGKIGSSATSGTNGTFGIGGTGGVGPGDPNHTGCGGGGGYYGGGASAWHAGSGGGSSYISGHNGCDAISSNSTEGSITHSGQSVHYSGKVFTNTVMIDGQGYSWTNTKGALQRMPNPSGGYYASGIGNSGNGVAKITLLNSTIYMNAYNTKYEYLPIPTKSGYVFLGWYTEPNGQGTKVIENTILTNTSDHTLYASWGAINEYTTSGSYTFTVPKSGLYKLEVWGAQGGSGMVNGVTKYAGGYGGYSKGEIYLETDTILYISVGGQGGNATDAQSGGAGGYNGGGKGGDDSNYTSSGGNEPGGGGGGATHIATSSGLLSTLSSSTSSILVVAGGGGGSAYYGGGGSGGGINGTYGDSSSTIFGTQTSGNSFGLGGDGIAATGGAGGGGAGYYGGGGGQSDSTSGGGGSGYIGNSLLKAKYMYCYNCTTSDEVNTKTYTTTNVSATPTANYAKSGSGAVKITFLGEDSSAPVGTITASKDYNNINVSISATDDFGIDHYEYYLSTSSTCPTEGYTISNSSNYMYNVLSAGTYYVCARVVDISDNVLSLKSDAINYQRVYSSTIKYSTNEGTITPNTGSYTWTTDSNGLIYQNGSIYQSVINYGSLSDLVNYNNSEFINITKAGYTVLDGEEWICSSGCTTSDRTYDQDVKYTAADFCDPLNANCTVTLKVNWKEMYTVSYNANGGSGAPSSQTKIDGVNMTLSSTVPTKDGYKFVGWATSSDATSATYAAGGTYSTNSSVTLYAVWKSIYTVPAFTYTGSYKIVDESNNVISSPSTWTGNWKIRFLSSGTFTSTSSIIVDIFAVGGGGGGGASGGCGGYTATKKTVKLQANTGYAITVGAGGAAGNAGGTSSFATFISAAGGAGPGGSGGSGGGGSGFYLSSSNHINGGNGGSNGSNGVNGWGTDGYHNGYGQGTTTREFGESSGTLYSGGGGGSGDCGYDFVNAGSGGAGGGGNGGFAFTNGGNGTANTGGGGGGGCKSDGSGYQGGYGGSGIVIIRNTKSSGNADAPMPTCTLSANATTITATVSTNGDSSIVYQGWNSTYSGTSSSSKSISVGMHTYYVKNKAGNTGECSAKVIATTENCECGAGFPQSGACYIGIIENGKWVGNRYYKECEYTYTCTSGTKINNSYCFKTY